ncbi:MAG: biotin--[acetyl-CoA-carboxylase] ligase [Xanthomonadaceae bacterium]|nr:biotin--[acetyl-CoA-carboxylase] ligase [Xanthomonadaceae bacterium]MDE2177597.1 biotin--[acetyl-CoA-carboxylase] ligase [Xanthomonadaceae bacterium]
MTTRTLLEALATGVPVSGTTLATQLGISRAAVWKQVQQLRARGLPVAARAGQGYALPYPLELLDADAMRAAAAPGTIIEVHAALDSTSSELLRHADQAADLTFVFAEVQSAGRGRRGRVWLAPPALNLTFSVLKRFERGFAALAGLSLAVGVAVAESLAATGVPRLALKWPNDLQADGRKLGGILIELGGEFLGPCHAVIGVGINLRLPPALAAAAGQPVTDLAALCGGTPPARNDLAARLTVALTQALEQFAGHGFAPFAVRYAALDALRDRALTVSGHGDTFSAIGAGVDARGALRVRREDGGVECLDSAEITVRAA